MTMLDVIDELFSNMGVADDELSRARTGAIAMFVKTTEDKERITRELSDEEVQKFRSMGLLYILAVLSSPDMQQKLKEHVEGQIKRN